MFLKSSFYSFCLAFSKLIPNFESFLMNKNMKIIHTADWHLGQSFYEYDRKTEHTRFLAWLKDIVQTCQADVLIIAGDIFDSPNPSAESQRIYYSFLREVTGENPRLQVIIIAGNHDSAARLEAPNPLLEDMSVTVKGSVKRTDDGQIDYENFIVPLQAGGVCLAVPYLRQGDYPEADSYSKGVQSLYHRLYDLVSKRALSTDYTDLHGKFTSEHSSIRDNPWTKISLFRDNPCNPWKKISLIRDNSCNSWTKISLIRDNPCNPCKKNSLIRDNSCNSWTKFSDNPWTFPVIAVGHLQATGSEISENDRSERTIIGGLECVSPEAFSEGIAYTALGHLHRGQRVSGRENVRYAGAPIAMSFAEKHNRQGVVCVEIDDTGTHIEQLRYEGAVEMLSIPREPKRLEEVLMELKNLPEGEITDTSPYLEIKILITEPEPSLRSRIDEALKGKSVRFARIATVTPERKLEETPITLDELLKISPMDMAEKVFAQQYGEQMPSSMKMLLQEVIRVNSC